MGWRGVVWYGAQGGNIKALLRSGDFPYQFWVGGDRPVPYGPLPVLTTDSSEVFPRTIISTGPGLDDWVVAYNNSGGVGNNNDVNIAFATVDGIVASRTVPQLSGSSFMITHSAGNFATHRTDRIGAESDGSERVYYWSTPTGNEDEPITGQEITGQTVGFAMPDVFVGRLLSSPSTTITNLKGAITHEADFSYVFNYLSSTSQRLFNALGEEVAITPAITDLSPFASFSLEMSMKDLILYRPTFPTPANAVQNIPTARWQLYPDGTWEALDPVTLTYNSNTTYTRLDWSYHP